MQKLLHKIAPLGVMTACVIWCCWSQLNEPTPLLAATEAKLPRIERKLLHPELSAVSERDPFLQYKPEPPPVSEVAVATVKVKEEPVFDPRTVLPSIRLDGTMPGTRPMAVINGKLHSAGENIVLDAAPEIQCRLERVVSDGIVVSIEKKTFLIGYSNDSREVTEPAPDANTVPQVPDGDAGELPEGIPTADELESAVADSLANQPRPTNNQKNLSFDNIDGLPTHAADEDEDCEFEKDLLNTNKFDELLNDHE